MSSPHPPKKSRLLLLQCPHHTQNASLLRTDSQVRYVKESKQREGGCTEVGHPGKNCARRGTWRMAGLALEAQGEGQAVPEEALEQLPVILGKTRTGALSKKELHVDLGMYVRHRLCRPLKGPLA